MDPPCVARKTIPMLAVLLLLAWAPQRPQAAPADEKQLKFTARAELVLVPVMVQDKSGAHLSKLTKEDFSVRENGIEQKIAVFEEVVTTAVRLRRAQETPTEFSNLVMGQPKPARLTVIALDTINTPFLDQARAREDLLKFLAESVHTGEPTALVTITRSGVKVIHDFTTDPAVLALALKKVKGGHPSITQADLDSLEEALANAEDAQALQREVASLQGFVAQAQQEFLNFQRRVAITETLEGMQQIAQAFIGVPGRKSLMWASGGFPFSINDSTMSLGGGFQREGLSDVLPLYERTWQLLNDANMAVYPVDVRGLVNPMFLSPTMRRTSLARQMALNSDTIGTFQTFAEMTGGRAFYNRNDLDRCFEEAAGDSTSYYMLGYYLNQSNPKPGWRRLDVKVRVPGAHVRARRGFFVTATTQDPEKSREADIGLALRSPLEYTGLPLTVRVLGVTPKGPRQKIELAIILPPTPGLVDEADNNHLNVAFVAIATDAQGKQVGDFSNTVDGHLKPDTLAKVKEAGLSFTNALELAPGDYTVRVVVRENLKGRLGSVSAPLTVK